MAKTSGDRVAALIQDVEKRARRLRADLQKRVAASGLPRRLQSDLGKLRRRVEVAARQVDAYVRGLERELGNAARKPRRKPARKRATARKG